MVPQMSTPGARCVDKREMLMLSCQTDGLAVPTTMSVFIISHGSADPVPSSRRRYGKETE